MWYDEQTIIHSLIYRTLHVIPRERSDRGNLPVQCMLHYRSLMDIIRRVPRHPFGVPRNDISGYVGVVLDGAEVAGGVVA